MGTGANSVWSGGPGANSQTALDKALHRTGRPDDIAAAIRYLAGPESSWVTGQSFAIDGGHELRRATNLEFVARSVWGDLVVDEALAGRIPQSPQPLPKESE